MSEAKYLSAIVFAGRKFLKTLNAPKIVGLKAAEMFKAAEAFAMALHPVCHPGDGGFGGDNAKARAAKKALFLLLTRAFRLHFKMHLDQYGKRRVTWEHPVFANPSFFVDGKLLPIDSKTVVRRMEQLQKVDPELANQLREAIESMRGRIQELTPRHRRRPATIKPRRLTPKQIEAAQIVGECKGNIAEAARRLGVDRKTMKEHFEKALEKMCMTKVEHRTQYLNADRRGQADVTYEDDRRRG